MKQPWALQEILLHPQLQTNQESLFLAMHLQHQESIHLLLQYPSIQSQVPIQEIATKFNVDPNKKIKYLCKCEKKQDESDDYWIDQIVQEKYGIQLKSNSRKQKQTGGKAPRKLFFDEDS
jgi:hypothetical protein